MSITDGYKQQIANCRARIITLRTQIQKIKEEKKRRMEALSKAVKIASTPMSKESYRKSKVMEGANYDKRIEAVKRDIESIKSTIERYKKKLYFFFLTTVTFWQIESVILQREITKTYYQQLIIRFYGIISSNRNPYRSQQWHTLRTRNVSRHSNPNHYQPRISKRRS